MDTTRRALLLSAAAATAGCGRLLSKATPAEQVDSVSVERSDNEVLLDKIGFGASTASLDRLEKVGRQAYLHEQLNPTSEVIPALKPKLRNLEVLEVEGAELRDLPESEILRQLQQASILRATYSPWQLHEKMVDFWTNHFNVYARKGLSTYRVPGDQSDVIRRHAFGSFPEMLKASAHSTAMLVYLDNQMNVAGQPNENYARELMELHTLGVNGGYSQQDVLDVARCFSGWGMETRFMRPRGQFRFNPAHHDSGAKVVLGTKIAAGGGKEDGDRVLDVLVGHPQTAKFIASKLCASFGLANHDEEVAKAYLDSNGSVKAMLGVILPALDQAKPTIKRPFEFMVSSLRRLGANTDGGRPLHEHLERMGQPLHQWPMPDGYPSHTAAWTGNLLPRWNFAIALASGRIPGTDVNLSDPKQAALALCSPDFQWS